MMMFDLRTAVAQALDSPPTDITPLGGGCIGQVFRIQLADGRTVVTKFDDRPQPNLQIEGQMLQYLAVQSNLPVPAVYHSRPELLVMEFVRGDTQFNAAAQAHAGELLAELHNVTAPQFGFPQDTLLGNLPLPNPWSESWIPFFREQRLRYVAQEAVKIGRLPVAFLPRIDRLAARLDEWLVEPARPSLIHGDIWTTNVLAAGDRITAFLDPAIYYGDPEMELAYITLFSTFQTPFFNRYADVRYLDPAFFTVRRHIYNLIPLLVHVWHFGGSYVQAVDEVLRQFGE
jgi:fructosamine-3-kinase